AWITAFLLGTFAAIFGPCRLAIMPNLVPKNQLTTTNAISSQVGNIATILGVPFGGFLVDVIGRNAGFYVDGAAFFAATCLLLLLKPSATRAAAARPTIKPFEELKVGLR